MQHIPADVLPQVLSPNGIRTSKFGPPGWRLIHLVALNYPLRPTQHTTRHYYEFFRSLCSILPCKYCRTEFCKMTGARSSPLFLSLARFRQQPDEAPGSARIRLFVYTLQLHATVSARLGRPQKPLAFYARMYARMRAGSHGARISSNKIRRR